MKVHYFNIFDDLISESPNTNTATSTTNKQSITDLGDLESGPCQPMLDTFPRTQFGKQTRCFSTTFYKKYSWLEYSKTKDKVFCFVCRQFSTNIPGGSSSDRDKDVFIKEGNQNWKKLNEKITKHESSDLHKTCVIKHAEWQRLKSSESRDVLDQVISYRQEVVAKNRRYLTKIIDILLYLSRQGLAFRGHEEKKDSANKGNFKELCEVFAKYDHEFAEMYEQKKGNYASHRTQNELLSICGSTVRDMICQEIRESGFFALMLDEARSFKTEQLSLSVRYTHSFHVYERFLKFIDCSSSRDAESLKKIVVNELKSLGIDEVPIVAQTYDGASVMSGEKGGLQAKIREIHECAIFTHCYAHKVGLVTTDGCKEIRMCDAFFNNLECLNIHFSKPCAHEVLKNLQIELKIRHPFEISQISDTRWACRFSSCDKVIERFPVIIQALQNEVDENSINSAEANGLLIAMTKNEFIVHLHIFRDVLAVSNMMSKAMQNSETPISATVSIIENVISTLEARRSDAYFDELWIKIVNFSEENNISLERERISKKRKSIQSSRLNDSVIDTTLGERNQQPNVNTKEYWRAHVFYHVIDKVVGSLKRRFSPESLNMAKSIDAFFGMRFLDSTTFINFYSPIAKVNVNLLSAEMDVCHNVYKTAHGKESNCDSTPENLKNLLKILESNQKIFPNFVKLVNIALSIPISAATCERSYSAMRRIRTYLRTSMTQTRFTDLSILHIENDFVSANLQPEMVLNKFSKTDKKRFLDL